MTSNFRIVPLIPGLVNEVALEIFLHFVAIDSGGSSTLVLVCTAWRDMVLGNKLLQSLRRKRRRPKPALAEKRGKGEEGICIVSFDGGGPGSMSQLRMLEEFMARLAFKEKAEVDELLPADYFDLMGGVGVGGLVAILLGRLRMTTSQAMEELARIGTVTFPEGEDMVTPEVNIVRLRKALESMLERNGYSVEIKLRDSSENRCKVVLFAATTTVMDHCHPFRTYPSPRKWVDCNLIDAACATMATPDYFPSVAVGSWPRRQSFAGIPHNFHNPMREVLKEAKLIFGENNLVSLILSLGAGQPARHSSLDHQITRRSRIHCDGVARDLQDQLRGFSEYLRLNVDKGMENIELDNWHELDSIETHTDVYLEMNQITRYIDRAVQLLLQRNGSVTLGKLSGTSADCVVKFHPESLEKYLAMEFKQMQDVIQEIGIEKFTLVDAIGKHIPIPKHFCRTYPMLLDVIKVYFRHQKPPGSDLVERGDYRLLHGSSRSIVDPIEWDQLENVRLKVEMSMILRTRNNDKATCPRCRTRSETPPTNGWATCTSCSGQFQIEDQLLEYNVQSGGNPHNEEFYARENSIVIPAASRESAQTSQGRSPIKVNQKIEREEELKFRLISVVNLLDILSNDSLASASLLSAPDREKLKRSPQENSSALDGLADSKSALPTSVSALGGIGGGEKGAASPATLAPKSARPHSDFDPLNAFLTSAVDVNMEDLFGDSEFVDPTGGDGAVGGAGAAAAIQSFLSSQINVKMEDLPIDLLGVTNNHSNTTEAAALDRLFEELGFVEGKNEHVPAASSSAAGVNMTADPDRRFFKKSLQENGPTLPTTQSLASAQPQPGSGRPPRMQSFNGMTPNKPNPMMGGMSFPAQGMMNGPPLGGPGMPTMAGQLRELTQTRPQHTQRARGALLNPTLQHLQPRKPGYLAGGPGTQMRPLYIQRPPGTQEPGGAPMGSTGQMDPMGQLQQRVPNGPVYVPNPNYRPQPGQQSPQQQQGMQTTGASGSPKQPGAPSTVSRTLPDHNPSVVAPTTCANCGTDTTPLWRRNGAGDTLCNKCGIYEKARGMARPVLDVRATDEQNPHALSPQLQGANGNAYDASGMERGTPRSRPTRGQKRPSPAEDDQYSKDTSPPDRKKFPQEHGSALPTTPSLASAQPHPGNVRTPIQMRVFNGMPPNKPNPIMGGMPFPGMTNGRPLGGPDMPPTMAGQLRELTQTRPQHTQGARGAPPSLLNPTLQHLQPRKPGHLAGGPGTQMRPLYIQRPPGTQEPGGAPMGSTGQMDPMGQLQQRIPNGPVYVPNPNYRPKPGQQSPQQQQQEMQTTGASGSPKQPGAPSTVSRTLPDHNPSVVAPTTCANCGTDTTPLWRRNGAGDTLCNKCGIYEKARGMARPVLCL